MTARRRPRLDPVAVAYAAAKTIALMATDEPVAERADMDTWAPNVIAAFQGSYDAFEHYDNRLWREPGFWMARSVRNHPTWGPALFASFKR